MTDEKICGACGLPYDWTGATTAGEEYCCEACCIGEECTCPQHDHRATTAPGQEWSGTAAAGIGTNPPAIPAGPLT
jgi:hypothetical protein